MSPSSALSPQARDQALAAMGAGGDPFELDVLVVGGGVTGAGTALDAVTRGLNTGLLEQRDLASGTSSRSSKLVHGGLRYLEMLDFGLVREALKERGLLLTRLAPHLVRPVPFLYPLTHRGWERPYVGSGLILYDGMAMLGALRSQGGDMGVPRHRHLTRRQVARIAPDFKADTIAGAIQYWDCQVDDARLVVALARTAAAHGAHVATRVKVTGFLREGERVVGVRALDLEAQREIEVRARVVVNAAGVWTDEIQEMVGGRGALNVQASKGIHLVVPRDRIRSEAGFIVRTATSVLFVIPWGRHWLVGTTDTDWAGDPAHPVASAADVDYLLGQVNRVLAGRLGRTTAPLGEAVLVVWSVTAAADAPREGLLVTISAPPGWRPDPASLRRLVEHEVVRDHTVDGQRTTLCLASPRSVAGTASWSLPLRYFAGLPFAGAGPRASR